MKLSHNKRVYSMKDLRLPKVIFGTSALGNLFVEPSFETKKNIVSEVIRCSHGIPLFDSAGKYGAGLALECLGRALEELDIPPSRVQISNKLGWKRIPLKTPAPTFERDAWVNLKDDAVQAISYDGILECFEQGNRLLGKYTSRHASVHDPDEFLTAATSEQDRQVRMENILDAYRALTDLKAQGEIDSIGIGSKDPGIIDMISQNVQLDWAMFACSVTPFTHTRYVVELLKKLSKQSVKIINSAVFNSGFLIGGDYFDYQKVTQNTHSELFYWRDKFLSACERYQTDPAAVCVQFSFRFPQVVSVALNTSAPHRVEGNMKLATVPIDDALWAELKHQNLIAI
jgi:D-threo-aldose 1-dehydrogenase